MNRTLWAFLGLILAGVIIAGCGASVAPAAQPGPARQVAPAPPFAAPMPTQVAAEAAGNSKLDSSAVSSAVETIDRLIIRNGSMTIIVKDVPGAVSQISDIANGVGGLVMRTDSRNQGDSLIATVVIKIPAEAFDSVMAQLRKLAVKVDADSSSSQDVTEEYVDLDARLKVYEATEQQLLKFLERTQNVDESLKVYRELNNVRSQIESLKGRMNYLKKSAAMSNITISLRPEPKDKPIVEENGFDPLRIVRSALRALVDAIETLAVLSIYAVIWLLPVLLILGVVFIIVRAVWRRLRRSRAK